MQEEKKNKTMINYAMEYGTWLGALLILKLLVQVLPLGGTVMHLLFIFILICIPVLFFRLVQLYALKIPYSPFLFSHLWSFGILIALFGSMLSGIVEYICYQYVVPEFLPTMIANLKKSLEFLSHGSDEGSNQVMAGMKLYLDNLEVPTPIQFVVQEILTSVFFGSMFSVFVSPVVVALKRRKEMRDKSKKTINE